MNDAQFVLFFCCEIIGGLVGLIMCYLYNVKRTGNWL